MAKKHLYGHIHIYIDREMIHVSSVCLRVEHIQQMKEESGVGQQSSKTNVCKFIHSFHTYIQLSGIYIYILYICNLALCDCLFERGQLRKGLGTTCLCQITHVSPYWFLPLRFRTWLPNFYSSYQLHAHIIYIYIRLR